MFIFLGVLMSMEIERERGSSGSDTLPARIESAGSSRAIVDRPERHPADLPFYRFFEPGFMRKHTDFASLEELFDCAPVALVELEDRFTRHPVFNRYIERTTDYRNWGDLFVHAVSDYLSDDMSV